MSGFGVMLAAHGCGDDSRANRRVRALAEEVSRRTGMAVIAGFNLGSPSWADAIDGLDTERVLVVPLMTSEGYFSGTVLPERCGAAESASRKRIRYAPPIGLRPELARAIVAQACATVTEFGVDPSNATVLVVGHGTRRHPMSADATLTLAQAIADAIPGADSRAVFLDQDPLLEHVGHTLTRRDILIIPHLLGGGDHAEKDIAERLALPADGVPPRAIFRDRRRYIFEPALLDHAGLLGAIVSTATEAHGAPPIRLGTRRSPLALWQAERVRETVERVSGRAVELVTFDASGDLNLSAPIDALPGESPFTDAISAALATGDIDLATHSLKDLPLEPDARLPIIGVLERGSVEEVLIARDGATLEALPPGARIGVSCARRSAQLRRLRPDLEPAPIRGPVDKRVAMVLDGTYDGAILAAAGVERLGLERYITQRFTLDEIAPAAGQGAIALQARAGDEAMRRIGALAEHAPTRRAIDAELAAARALEPAVEPMVVAVAARACPGREIELFVRVVSRDTRFVHDETVRADGPASLAREAAARILSAIDHPASVGGAS